MRRILHVDMDAFYASVEQRDDSRLRGRPVIVGADPANGTGRGVVAACSYEARVFGVHSAQPIRQAWRRCPEGVFVRPRFDRYREVSGRIMAIFGEYTDLVEPLSIDEAFLDVTGSARLLGAADGIARDIRRRIAGETGLTASIGVASSKFLAKLASDFEKPNGLVLVPEDPDRIAKFLEPLAIERLWGVGPKTAARLRRMGLATIADLRAVEESVLVRELGKAGAHLSRLAHGVDDRPVLANRDPKSISNERTFGEDTSDPERVRATLAALADRVAARLRAAGFEGAVITLKLRYSDFTTYTRQCSPPTPTADAAVILRAAGSMLDRLPGSLPVRLVGVGVGHLSRPGDRTRQLALFSGRDPGSGAELGHAIDRIHERFGERSLYRASSLRRVNP
jgi:nucleotidyltransferase/DNA polymerase involved in DNA repair